MNTVRILLRGGGEIETHDAGVEEIDDLNDRIRQQLGGKPGWLVIGDALVHTQGVDGFEVR